MRGFNETLGTLRRHCVGAGSAATFTPALWRDWEPVLAYARSAELALDLIQGP